MESFDGRYVILSVSNNGFSALADLSVGHVITVKSRVVMYINGHNYTDNYRYHTLDEICNYFGVKLERCKNQKQLMKESSYA
jgi:hypothetical protein